jgi:integrase
MNHLLWDQQLYCGMEKMNTIKEVWQRRYEYTAYRNVSLSYTITVLPSVPPLDPGMILYTQVITHMERENLAENNRQQQLANYMTTLNSYLTFIGKTHSSPVGPELSRNFDETSRRYCEALGLSERTVRDRRSHLNKWRAVADELRSADCSRRVEQAKKPSDFHDQLRCSVAQAGVPPKTLAKAVNMSPDTLQRWMRGAVPNVRARPAIARIETYCGLPRGQLGEALAKHDKPDSTARPGPGPGPGPGTILYRQELSKRTLATYFLKVRDFLPPLLNELQSLYAYKTSRRPSLARSSRGVWGVSLPAQRPEQPVVPFAPNAVCVSYTILTEMLEGFLGYLCLDLAAGGFGRTRAEAQTLAWLAVPDAIDGYMSFLQDRSGNLVHAGHTRFARQVINLVQPQTGFLTQQPAYADQLPQDVRPDDWQATCAEAKMVATEWKQAAVDKSRDPALPIANLLVLQEPLKPVINAIRELDKQALANPEGSVKEAVYKRDALLLSLLIVNPLRIRNFVLMSVAPSRSGYLYQSATQYRISIPKSGFKNASSSAVQDYDVGIPAFLSSRIEEYLDIFRPVLIGDKADSGLLFPSRSTGGVYATLGLRIQILTARLIPGCPGIGPHAFRHLVATAWLKKNPNDFLTVAELLNDRLETVMRNYAHLIKDDSLAKHAAQIENLFEN